MKTNKVVGLIMLVATLFGLAIVGGGCSTNYDETYYQGPNWTPEGLIYCQKSVTHYQKDPLGTITLGTDYSYVTMDTDGNNETTLPYNSCPYYSPKGTYVALISGKTVSIVRRSDNQRVYSFSPSSDSIESLDWGPDEDKLVYLLSSKELCIINVDGTSNTTLASSIESVAWQVGNRIVSVGISGSTWGGRVFDSNSNTDLFFNPNLKGGELNISKVNTNEVVYRGDSINIIDISSGGALPSVLINRNDLWNIHLSPNGQKIVASGNNITGEQIWLIDINGAGLKQIK